MLSLSFRPTRRQRWRSWQAGLDPERLVFIDETWTKTNMAPTRGWGPKGRHLHGHLVRALSLRVALAEPKDLA